MKVRDVLLVALAAAVTLASVASAVPDAAKQRVAITAKILPTGAAVLTPLENGALEQTRARSAASGHRFRTER
jgi:hypothetical protein